MAVLSACVETSNTNPNVGPAAHAQHAQDSFLSLSEPLSLHLVNQKELHPCLPEQRQEPTAKPAAQGLHSHFKMNVGSISTCWSPQPRAAPSRLHRIKGALGRTWCP